MDFMLGMIGMNNLEGPKKVYLEGMNFSYNKMEQGRIF